MSTNFNTLISKTLNISEKQIANTIKLLDEGATIPFISRYRKEMTGALDEVQIAAINDTLNKLKEIEKRKNTILSTIEEQGKLTTELKSRIETTWDATVLEDIYLPFKPKRRTRAEMAREKGLEPLATFLMFQQGADPLQKANTFVKDGIKDADEALKGARDIIAEWVNEDEKSRNNIRNVFAREATISSKVVKGKEEEGSKYRDYFDWSEPLKRCSSHRMLALRRGENEGILKVSIEPEDEHCIERLEHQYVKGNNAASQQVAEA
ncbi:MAG: Tex-like N-terminal domain-containing protein, partial [Bacteroidales bacterium]